MSYIKTKQDALRSAGLSRRIARMAAMGKCVECGVFAEGAEGVKLDIGDGVELPCCKRCLGGMAPGLRRFQEDRLQTSAQLLAKYGISVEDYEQMYAGQKGRCTICRKAPGAEDRRLAVDHDHETGAVRGLLCHRCNLAIGLLGDDADKARRMAGYLRKRQDRRELRRAIQRAAR